MLLRREFLQYSFLTSTILIFSGCEVVKTTAPFPTLNIMQQDLFPINTNVPTLKDINAFSYLYQIFEHPRVSEYDKEFLKNGVKWINQESFKKFNRLYIELNSQEREEILQIISKEIWGKNFIRDVMSFIYEALLCDDIYGANQNGVGWKWLNHKVGLPRPTKANL